VSDHRSAVAASFDQRAPTYDASALHREVAVAVAEFAALAGIRSVLDVATGTGLVLRAIGSRNARIRLIGVDISAGMLEVARRELPSAALIAGQAERLPVSEGSVDLVTCVTAMHLMDEPGAVFAEMARVLAPQGRLVLATFQVAPDQSYANRPYRTNHPAFATPDLVAAAAAPAGFTPARTKTGRCGDDLCLLTELAL
jgi:ubiquinone/menaquinone biosynthesis C-methylase UbiE